jgi:hypothetical protein
MAFQESALEEGVLIRLLRALPRSLKVLDLERTRVVNGAVGHALVAKFTGLPQLELLNLAEALLTPPAALLISQRLPLAAKLKLVPSDTLTPQFLQGIKEELGERFIE